VSAETQTTAAATGAGPRPYRFTVRQYMKMIAAGVFPEGARVELLGGLVVRQMTKYAPHNFTTGRLSRLLRDLLPPDWLVQEEKSVVIGPAWRPEPDVAVVRGPDDRYRAADPTAADLGLIVEVAESSYRDDRGPKWRGYAAAGVPAYWIVDLNRRRVEVHEGPQGRGKRAGYQREAFFGPGASMPLALDGREAGVIAIDDLLP